MEGDILWVRETWFSTRLDCNDLLSCGVTSHLKFKADNNYDPNKDCVGRSWKPSIHMPKAAARIFLRVISVRCERLTDITEEDAEAEGVEKFHHGYTGSPRGIWYRDYLYGGGFDQENARKSFLGLWKSINGKESVKKNPWVFIYEFEKTEKPENFLNN